MNRKQLLTIAGLMLTFGAGSAWSQDQRWELDETMRLAGEALAVMPAAVTDQISLPADVAEDAAAVAASEDGLIAANAWRLRRAEGLEITDEAREAASDFTDAAQDNAESASRGEDFIPDVPNVPDVPGGG